MVKYVQTNYFLDEFDSFLKCMSKISELKTLHPLRLCINAGLILLVELQTFMSDAVWVVNNQPLTTVSDKPNDLALLCLSSFLGATTCSLHACRHFYDRGDLQQDRTICITPPLHKGFRRVGLKGIFQPGKNVGNGGFLRKTFHQVNLSWLGMQMIFQNMDPCT